MTAFSDHHLPYQDELELVEAHRRAWHRLAAPGSWWTGAERVAIAAESRAARSCSVCAEAKAALSPNAVRGVHGEDPKLSCQVRGVIHRIISDPNRLSKAWFDSVVPAALSAELYVELLGVLTQVLSIDTVHLALGTDLEPLPVALPGDPDRRRPSQAADEGAWVAMIAENKLGKDLADLYGGAPITGNVLRALSLVPNEVRALRDLGAAHYVPDTDVINIYAGKGGVLSRPQVELIAARVSSINECFY